MKRYVEELKNDILRQNISEETRMTIIKAYKGYTFGFVSSFEVVDFMIRIYLTDVRG